MKNSSPDFTPEDVCIIGGGAIGKTAALALAKTGLRVVLVAPPPPPATDNASWDARVFAVNQIAYDLLNSVKVWDALYASRVTVVDAMVVRGDAEPDPGLLTFDAYSARVGALAWILEDRNLSQALDTALKFASNLRLVRARPTAAALRSDGQGVKVSFDDGTALDTQLLIGADGRESWVRAQNDIAVDYRSYGQRAIVSNFACTKPHHGVAYQWFTAEEGIVALLPLAGQNVSLVWSAPDALAATLLDESLSSIAQRLTLRAGEQLGQLTPLLPETVKSFPLTLIKPKTVIAPRTALIGDAAHVVHPLAGHGMNLGFADIAALVTILGEMRQSQQPQDCGDARLLARYSRMRKEDVLLMQVATDTLARLFSVDVAPLRLARNIGMNLLNRLPAVKRQLMTHALGNK